MGKTTYSKSRQAHISGRLLPISDSLIRSVLASEPIPEKQPKKELMYNGPKGYAVRKTGKPPVLPDEVILGVRTMREQFGMMPKQLMEVFNLTSNQVHAIIEYRYRSHLVPERKK